MLMTEATGRFVLRARPWLVSYLAVGVICALWYLFHEGSEAALYVLRLPVGWVTVAGLVVGWPLMLGFAAWHRMTATDQSTGVIALAAVVQAASAVAMVVLTWVLARTTREYARETKRMANVMARDFGAKVAPQVAIEVGNMVVVNEWVHAKVPVTVTNLGSQAVHVLTASLKFWADGGPIHTVSLPAAEGAVVAQGARSFDMTIPLSTIPENERRWKGAGGHVSYQIAYTAKGAVGNEVAGLSDEFRLGH